MTVTIERAAETSSRQDEWFANWFDSPHYHQLYSHRDEGEAAEFIDNLLEVVGPPDLATALDLGCGAGRHARHLASKGLDVTGIDLAANSIQQAMMAQGEGLRFKQGDMLEPFGDEAFDYVFNLFTSFGYFDSLFEHVKVLRNIANALKPGGVLVMDYLNVAHAESRLKRNEVVSRFGTEFHVTRWSDADRFYKRISFENSCGRRVEHTERVMKFTLQEFKWLFAFQGLQLDGVYGDYRLGDYDVNRSPRMIMIVRKASPSTNFAMPEQMLEQIGGRSFARELPANAA
jgi:SAM-dependent methyltransferase